MLVGELGKIRKAQVEDVSINYRKMSRESEEKLVEGK